MLDQKQSASGKDFREKMRGFELDRETMVLISLEEKVACFEVYVCLQNMTIILKHTCWLQYTDFIHEKFEEIQKDRGSSEKSRSAARSPFGVTGRKDWWGRSKLWDSIFENVLPKRMASTSSRVALPRSPPRFDETVSVVNSWYHATGFGILQRMLAIILKQLTHEQLQAFYLILDTFHEEGVYKEAAAPTSARNFFLTRNSKGFSKRISRMVDSYSNMFVACEALEIVMGEQSREYQLFRNLLSLCVSYLFDFGEAAGISKRKDWEVAVCDILEECVSVNV